MFRRGRMYSDKVGQWSPKSLRNAHHTIEKAILRVPAGAEAEGQAEIEAGASHHLHVDARGRSVHGSKGNNASWQDRRNPPVFRRVPNRSRSSSSVRSGLQSSSSYSLMRRSASPDGGEHTGQNTRQNTRQPYYAGRSPGPRISSNHRHHHPLDRREGQHEVYERRRLRDDLISDAGHGEVGRWDGCSNSQSPAAPPRIRRINRGGGVGIRGRGRQAFGAWGRFGGRDRRRSHSYSPTADSEEDHKRSRSREKARRRRQYETIQRYCQPGGEQQVCWDGFQWVRKGDQRGDVMFDQNMNATRKARRLHIGNLPLLLEATEEELKQFLWDSMRLMSGKYLTGECPVLHVWFSKERGGNYGFVEMASVEDAQAAIALNPLVWKGQQLRINRPTDWKKESAVVNFAEISGVANVALLESVAAATAIAETTGDSSALAKLLSALSEASRNVVVEFLAKCPTGLTTKIDLPVELLQCQIQAELLHGQASRVVRITNPVPEMETDEEMEETLSDVLEEVNRRKDVLAALIITRDLERQLPAAELGDIYVQFATSTQADICILSFAGRLYDGRPLAIERFNEMVWRQSMQKFAKSLLKEILARFI